MRPSDSNDIAPPEGYLFLVERRGLLGHLSVSDEEQALPLCGVSGAGAEAVVNLPPAVSVCPTCLSIADEASTPGH